jgi:iron only hydrogenase large subunit-like protein
VARKAGEEAGITYYHSVGAIETVCESCTHCVRVCPTEAIRVPSGYPEIDEERCIDCGACIRVCPVNAMRAYSDPFNILKEYKYNVAIPARVLAGQFKSTVPYEKILSGLKALGFDEVVEAGLGAKLIGMALAEYVKKPDLARPLISSYCPAVVRLIQVRFSSLVDHILPVETPMDAVARVVNITKSRELGLDIDDIGVFYIAPCPAKVTAVKQPVAVKLNYLTGAIAVRDVYDRLMSMLEYIEEVPGIAKPGGLRPSPSLIAEAPIEARTGRHLEAEGLENVLRILEKVEDADLDEYDFVELYACTGGCVGGVLNPAEPFVAKERLDLLARKKANEEFEYESLGITEEEAKKMVERGDFFLKGRVEPRPILKLGTDMAETIAIMGEIENIQARLPGIDCSACGCPSCRALAEDIALGDADILHCTFMLRDKIKELTEEMVDLSGALPPTMKKKGEPKG